MTRTAGSRHPLAIATLLLGLTLATACGSESGEAARESGATEAGDVLVDQTGTLGPGDSRLETGEFVDRYQVEVDVGQTIVADGGTTSLMSLISDFRSESTARFGTGYLPGV